MRALVGISDSVTANFIAKTVLLLVALIALLAFVAHGLIEKPSDKTANHLGLRLAEFLVQLIVIVVSGGVFMHRYGRLQNRKNAINEFRRATLKNLIEIYSKTKMARRQLKASVVVKDGSEFISHAAYEKYMIAVNEMQLALEVVNRELAIFNDVIDDNQGLTGQVRTMEKYLDKLVNEYEDAGLRDQNLDPIPLQSLPCLNAFIGRSPLKNFEIFSEAARCALEIFQKERVKLA
ncbi:hypothetical protein [Azohydromonas aeria]|uniref:hypothetical protein n=1 Tax=Azohydromonas aeria TaxID=2590212 RepID=UPI0012F86363|nr:hypothetical protein [Azohydromonas aeria]